jgi:hypothetical protein
VRGQDLLEVWFPGVHADVGGGYPESAGGLWREPFLWMLGEAKQSGVLTDPSREHRVLTRAPVPEKPWAEPQHESLTWVWWPAELFPKLRYNKRFGRRLPSLGLGRRRHIEPRSHIHRSAVERMDSVKDYAPRNVFRAELDVLLPQIDAKGTAHEAPYLIFAASKQPDHEVREKEAPDAELEALLDGGAPEPPRAASRAGHL